MLLKWLMPSVSAKPSRALSVPKRNEHSDLVTNIHSDCGFPLVKKKKKKLTRAKQRLSTQSLEFRDVPMAGFDFDPHSTIIEDNGYIGEMVESVRRFCLPPLRCIIKKLQLFTLPTSVPGGIALRHSRSAWTT